MERVIKKGATAVTGGEGSDESAAAGREVLVDFLHGAWPSHWGDDDGVPSVERRWRGW